MAIPDRLQHLGDEIVNRQGVIITAPAGYAKTTLMITAADFSARFERELQ